MKDGPGDKRYQELSALHPGDRALLNMSVWESVGDLKHFTFKSGHAPYLRRKKVGRGGARRWRCSQGLIPLPSLLLHPHTHTHTHTHTHIHTHTHTHQEWFEKRNGLQELGFPLDAPHHVCWWVEVGHKPGWDEGLERLRKLADRGESRGDAFTFFKPFPPPGVETGAGGQGGGSGGKGGDQGPSGAAATFPAMTVTAFAGLAVSLYAIYVEQQHEALGPGAFKAWCDFREGASCSTALTSSQVSPESE